MEMHTHTQSWTKDCDSDYILSLSSFLNSDLDESCMYLPPVPLAWQAFSKSRFPIVTRFTFSPTSQGYTVTISGPLVGMSGIAFCVDDVHLASSIMSTRLLAYRHQPIQSIYIQHPRLDATSRLCRASLTYIHTSIFKIHSPRLFTPSHQKGNT
jgi:hypothetical protein